MKKLFVSFLIFILIFAVGCAEKTPHNEVIIPEKDTVPFDEVRIIRADSSEKYEADAAALLRKTIKEKYGVTVDLTTDWTTQRSVEIVVGNTNRRDPDILKLDEYRVLRDGNSIFVAGGSEEALVRAVEYFCAKLTSENGIEVPRGYDHLEGASSAVGAIILSGREIGSIRIYSGYFGSSYAQKIADLIVEKVGISAEIVSDIDDANLAFIDESEEIAEGECGIVCTKSSILLVASEKYAAKSVYDHFVSILNSAEDRLELEGVVYHERVLTKEDFYKEKHLVVYPEFPSEIKRIYDYDVSVSMDGKTEKLPVYNHVCDMNVTRRSGTDMYRRFSLFAFCGDVVRVDIKVKKDFGSYTVFPSAKNFRHEFRDGVISVYLDKPEYFGIQLDDDANSILSVFADYPEFEPDVPAKGDPNVIYVDGFTEVKGGRLTVTNPNTTVYIAPGAVLCSRVKFDAQSCTLTGRGILLDPYSNIFDYDITESRDNGSETHLIDVAWKGKNFVLDGPVLLDARTSNAIIGGEKASVKNTKLLSTLQSANGFTINGSNQTLEHCFVYTGENAIVSGSSGIVNVKDITVGSTNVAMFPQGACDFLFFEDINVFRAELGIISNQYNGNGEPRQTKFISFDHINAVDLPDGYGYLFLGRNMGTLPKNYSLSNISVPELQKTVFFENGKSYAYTSGYNLIIKNLAIGGNLVKSTDDMIISNDSNAENTISVESDKSYAPVKRNIAEVNYKANGKIFVGARQIFFDGSPYENGGKLPSDELCELIGIKKSGKSAEMTPAELVNAGIISSYEEKDGSLYLTVSSDRDNLLIPDGEKLSRFSDYNAYQVDITADRGAKSNSYTAYAKKKSAKPGISFAIADEIRMYGTGKYTLTFNIKADENGEIKTVYQYDGEKTIGTAEASPTYETFSFEFEVTDKHFGDSRQLIVLRFSDDSINEFTVSDITLTKK